ncbi:hypothetical protein [Mycoplasmopsis columboralis]|nr:hypothetical protein [Mycoplasmopsis columboralis]
MFWVFYLLALSININHNYSKSLYSYLSGVSLVILFWISFLKLIYSLYLIKQKYISILEMLIPFWYLKSKHLQNNRKIQINNLGVFFIGISMIGFFVMFLLLESSFTFDDKFTNNYLTSGGTYDLSPKWNAHSLYSEKPMLFNWLHGVVSAITVVSLVNTIWAFAYLFWVLISKIIKNQFRKEV